MSTKNETENSNPEQLIRAIDDTKIQAFSGWLTPIVADLSDMGYHIASPFIGNRVDAQINQDNYIYATKRSRIVDYYVIACLIIEVACYLLATQCYSYEPCPRSIIQIVSVVLTLLILVNALAATLRLALFDTWFNPVEVRAAVASHPRIVILGLINFIQIMFGFGVFYALSPDQIRVPDGVQQDWIDPLYLSCMTQMTIGYGDRHPEGWLRVVAIIQSLFTIIFIAVHLPRAIGMMPEVKSIEDEFRNKLKTNTEKIASSNQATDKQS
ncbi:hypothetical protein GC163_19910 [bacterium]|nr:hypothetical protein [bacterium]